MMRDSGDRGVVDPKLEFAKQVRSDESPFVAIGNVSVGGTVFLGPDDWNVNGQFTINKKVQLHGRGSTITAQSSSLTGTDAFITIEADEVVIHRVYFKNDAQAGRAIYINADRVHITECEFDGFDTGIYISQANFCQITHNTFTNCGNFAIRVLRGNGCAIQDNLVTDNPATDGIFMDSTTQNCLITGNILPTGSIEYWHNSTNQPDNATKASYTNVANSITVN